jgi:hypothetical protein
MENAQEPPIALTNITAEQLRAIKEEQGGLTVGFRRL